MRARVPLTTHMRARVPLTTHMRTRVPLTTHVRDLPPFAALDSAVYLSSIWPVVRHNRQFFPKGSVIMQEGSVASGVWVITHGCATRSIAAASSDVRQQQLVIETLVPGQSMGWEELTLQMRPDWMRQVSRYRCIHILARVLMRLLQAPVTNLSSVTAVSDVRTIFVPDKEIKGACSSPEFLFVQVLFAQPVLAASALMSDAPTCHQHHLASTLQHHSLLCRCSWAAV